MTYGHRWRAVRRTARTPGLTDDRRATHDHHRGAAITETIECPQTGPLVVHVDVTYDRELIRQAFEIAWEGVIDILEDLTDPDGPTSRAILMRPEGHDRVRVTIEPNVGQEPSDA